MPQTYFNPEPAGVPLDFPHTYAPRGRNALDKATLTRELRELAPEIGGFRVEAGVLRTWRPLPPKVARQLKLRMLR